MASDSEETKLCTNCRNEIPCASFTLHEIHCSRRVRFCGDCETAVNISSWDEHMDQFHSRTPCVKCKIEVVKNQMERHLLVDCAHRKVHCDQCELDMPFKDLAAHEDYCKTRTEYCEACKKYINVRSLDNHDCRLDPEPERRQLSRMDSMESQFGALGGSALFGADTASLDPDTRLLMNMQLQEIQKARARSMLQNGATFNATDDFVPFGLSSRETTFAADDSDMPCPNCAAPVNIERMETHLLSCTSSTDNGLNEQESRSTEMNAFAFQDDRHDSDTDRCQWCSQNIPTSQFLDHFRVCFDGHIRNPLPKTQRPIVISDSDSSDSDVMRVTAPAVDKQTENENKIPCEFCDRLIEFTDFENHIFTCNRDASVASNGGLQAPDVPLSDDSSDGRIASHEPATNNEANNDLIPCEFCDQNIRIEQLMAHQLSCTPLATTSFRDEDSPRMCVDDSFNSETASPMRPQHPYGRDTSDRAASGSTAFADLERKYGLSSQYEYSRDVTEQLRTKIGSSSGDRFCADRNESNSDAQRSRVLNGASGAARPLASRPADAKTCGANGIRDRYDTKTYATNGTRDRIDPSSSTEANGSSSRYGSSSQSNQGGYKSSGSFTRLNDTASRDPRNGSDYRGSSEINGTSSSRYAGGSRPKAPVPSSTRTTAPHASFRSSVAGVSTERDRRTNLVSHSDNLRRQPVTRERPNVYKSNYSSGQEKEQ